MKKRELDHASLPESTSTSSDGQVSRPSKRQKTSQSTSPWDKLTVVELKAHLKDQNLPVSGRLKTDLIQRLEDNEVVVDERLLQSMKKNTPKRKRQQPKKKTRLEKAMKKSEAVDIQWDGSNNDLTKEFVRDKRDRAKSIISQSTLHITVFKSSKDTRLGLGIKKAEGGASLRVESINPGSLFEGSDLKVGMMIQSVNKIPFTSFKNGLALLQEAEGECKIMVFNPLEVSDEDQALAKWYKDDLASRKIYKKIVEVGDRVKVTSEGDRVWIVKSIQDGARCELRDESNKKNFVYASIIRVHPI